MTEVSFLGKLGLFKDGFSLNSTNVVMYFNCSYRLMLKLDPVYPDVTNGRVPDQTMGNTVSVLLLLKLRCHFL